MKYLILSSALEAAAFLVQWKNICYVITLEGKTNIQAKMYRVVPGERV